MTTKAERLRLMNAQDPSAIWLGRWAAFKVGLGLILLSILRPYVRLGVPK